MSLESGNGRFPGLPPFPADRLEIIFSSFVEIRENAISTCPPFPPPTGDEPALDMVGRPRPWGRERLPMSFACCYSE
jgi:hypothetical protein